MLMSVSSCVVPSKYFTRCNWEQSKRRGTHSAV